MRLVAQVDTLPETKTLAELPSLGLANKTRAQLAFVLGESELERWFLAMLRRMAFDQIVSEFFLLLWFPLEATLHNLKVAVQFKQYMIHMFSGSCVRKVRSYLRRIFLSNRIHRWPLRRRLAEGNCCR